MSITLPTAIHPAFAERVALSPPAPRAASGAAAPDSTDRRKLQKASEEFEAILIAEWWKSASTGISGLSEEDEGGLQAFRDFSQQAMSLALAQAGGLGLGRMLLQYLEPGMQPVKTSQEDLRTKREQAPALQSASGAEGEAFGVSVS